VAAILRRTGTIGNPMREPAAAQQARFRPARERHRGTAQALYRSRGFEDYDRYLLTKWLQGARRGPREGK
jgi:hypothetical protein